MTYKVGNMKSIQGMTKQINRKRDRKSEQKYDIGIILV